MQKITLRVGSSSITIDQTSITLEAMMIKIHGELSVQIEGMTTQITGDAMLTLQGGVTMIG